MITTVSIITPTYNRAHLLPKVWSSLLQQTEVNFQWIIVDDGSIDNTYKVVQDFDDPRITYVWQPNQGVNNARNRGEQEILADYVIYLDSDDELYDENTLREMLGEIRATSSDIAWVSFTVVDSDGCDGPFKLISDRLETNYIDHVCEKKIRGEFFSIYRRDAIALSPWPPYNGLEALRHWRIIKERPAMMVNRPGRIYNQHVGDNLTGARSTITRSPEMATATIEFIKEHKSSWLSHCPCQIGKYHFNLALYFALSGETRNSLSSITYVVSYAKWNIKIKSVAIVISLCLPLLLRRKLFVWRSNILG